MRSQSSARPELSVLVPTYQRPERVAALLDLLELQSIDPARFELVLVDDGSSEPVVLDRARPFHVELLRQPNQGPAAARNLGLQACRGELCLILNDDALPARDLLEVHVRIHADNAQAAGERLAVLGTFHFSELSRKSPFVDLLDRTDLLFDFSPLRDQQRYGWPFFWTCNISLPTQALRSAGGFDAHNFPDIVEDCELGYRLEQQGFRVLHCASARCEHEHVLTVQAFFARSRRLGQSLARMYHKHADPRVLRLAPATRVDETLFRQMQATYEQFHPQLERVESSLSAVERQYAGRALPDELVGKLAELVGRVNAVPFYRGMLEVFTGHDPEPVMRDGPRTGETTSVIMLSCSDLAATRRCLEALRRTREAEHPLEIIVVDNGSRDGSRAWLAEQDDVRAIFNDENLGAPHARNQALEIATGRWLVFLDNDAIVSPGWLSGLLFHAQVDALCACVGPLSDRAAHGQQISYAGGSQAPALERFAGELHERNRRGFKLTTLLSSFCLLVDRSLIDAIGGFDERFSPWGFEDDDFTLRAALSGRHNRIALDVFVKHEVYRGPKLAHHSSLLARNWRRFRDKWNLPKDAAHGDYTGLAAHIDRAHSRDELYLPLTGQPVRSDAHQTLLFS